jgi:hypothetical protein
MTLEDFDSPLEFIGFSIAVFIGAFIGIWLAYKWTSRGGRL